MSRDFARIKLPEPPREYSPEYERIRNARIEDLIHRRAALNDLAPYGGIPHAVLVGNNAAFPVPGGGVITLLPYNTVVWPNADLLDSSVPVFKLAYKMNIQSFVMLHHVSGAGGQSTVSTYAVVNGINQPANTQTIALGDADIFTRTLFTPNVLSGNTIGLALSHTGNQPLILDMTKSRFWLNQLTPDPQYTQSDTRP